MRYDTLEAALGNYDNYPDLAPDYVAHDFQRRRIGSVAALIHARDRVLDIGCNSGHLATLCPEAEVHGVDINPDLVAKASKVMAGAHVAAAEDLPFDDRSFDVACLSGMLELVYDPDLALAEAWRVSRRSLIGTTTHADGGWGRLRIPSHKWHARCFDEAEITKLLARYGRIRQLGTIDHNGQPQCWWWEIDV